MAVFSFVWVLGFNDAARGESEPFTTLRARLIQDGFDTSLIQSLYARPEVTFDHQGVSAYFLHREATLNYDQFLTQASIEKANAYLGKHHKALTQAQSVYGVEHEIITAIILVETRLGTFVGKSLVLNTLSTLAALDDKDRRNSLWSAYLKGKAGGSKHQFDAWASRKSTWAYNELKAYLKYAHAQGVDPLSMPGSFAGALGIAQFVPSSALKFAQDGNGDGQVNLFDHEDAIMSVANYLHRHGWRTSLTRNEAFRVLLHYNRSVYYAETILDVAERVAAHRKRQ